MTDRKNHITLIGAGHLAHHLAEAFSDHQIKIHQIFNHRATTQAKNLAKKYHTELITDIKKLSPLADIFVICVTDEVIPSMVKQLKTIQPQGIVLHTSGSTDMSILKPTSNHIGVFYPLQTFSIKDTSIDWKNIPILIEGGDQKTTKTLKKIAALMSSKVEICDSSTRLKMHLTAVMVSNYTNALFVEAYDYLLKENLVKHFSLLKPLINQTIKKLDNLSPLDAQTGPAKRHDKKTIQKHLKLLKSYPNTKEIYQLMTKTIQRQQNKTD